MDLKQCRFVKNVFEKLFYRNYEFNICKTLNCVCKKRKKDCFSNMIKT